MAASWSAMWRACAAPRRRSCAPACRGFRWRRSARRPRRWRCRPAACRCCSCPASRARSPGGRSVRRQGVRRPTAWSGRRARRFGARGRPSSRRPCTRRPWRRRGGGGGGVGFAGHTELLQAEAAAYQGLALERMPVRMMLANAELRTVLVSIHVSLRAAIAALTFGQLLQTLQITHAALTRSLGHAPRIAVAGLNPRAGEGGLFGREELEVIAPAIAAARAQGMQVHGPFAPDTVFMRARSRPQQGGEFDVVIAMYHDQGLIPIKYLGLDRGVNVTLGLPLVRTSPDHGTAFDIAGQGVADAASLIEAVRMARTLCGAGA